MGKLSSLLCVGASLTVTVGFKFSALIQLDGWQQSATHSGSSYFLSVSSELTADSKKRPRYSCIWGLTHSCYFERNWVGNKEAPREALCKNMKRFFQTASKDSHDLEVTSPFPWANKHDVSPSLLLLHLSFSLFHHGNPLCTTYFQLFLWVKAETDGAALRNEWCGK